MRLYTHAPSAANTYAEDMTTRASRGGEAISASPTQARKRTKYDRRQPTSIALTLRNLIVLTIRNAGTSTIASAGKAVSRKCRPYGYQNTVAAMTDAAAGLGIPTKYRLS